jgi:nucleoside-diphosphate-sugar epimerase
MRLLLLGASGFLGSHIVRAAEPLPDIDLVRHTRRGEVGPGVELDLAAAGSDQLRELLERVRPDVVVNAVGATGSDPEMLAALNVGVIELLLAALQGMLASVRLVTFGSAAEYGPTPAGEPIDETRPARPVSAYGRTKLAGTRLVVEARDDGRVDGVVLRVFNPLGAGMPASTLAGSAARQLRSAIASGEAAIRLGPLGDYRDFVDARDVADAVLAVAQSGHLDDPILNVGSGVAVRSRDLVEQLADLAGFRGEVLEDNAVPERSGAVHWQQAATGRLRRIGWERRRTLRDSLMSLWHGGAGT